MGDRSNKHRGALRMLIFGVIACGSPTDPSRVDVALDATDAWMPDAQDASVIPDAALVDAVLDSVPDVLPDGGNIEALPETLSEAGLFVEGVAGAYAAGVRSYDVRYPLWTDAAEKLRHILLPEGEGIDVIDANHWAFPVGTRIYKEFRVEGAPVETRLLWKRSDGAWVYVSYVYRADGSDADAAPGGATDVLGTGHDVPTQAQCDNCHQGGGDFVLGIGAVQLDRTVFAAWTTDGLLPMDAEPADVPGDVTEQAALGYLHANCGHCHGENHPLARQRGLRLWLPVGVVDPMDAPAWQTSVGMRAFHDLLGSDVLVVPGDAEASQLFLRMGVRDETQMPSLGTGRVDEAGLAAVRAWIER